MDNPAQVDNPPDNLHPLRIIYPADWIIAFDHNPVKIRPAGFKISIIRFLDYPVNPVIRKTLVGTLV